jgi:hypothetical protein
MAQIDIKQIRGGTQGSILFLGTNSVVSEDYSKLNWDISNDTLNINAKLRIQDGTEGVGYVLISDATGLASWTSSVSGSSNLITSSYSGINLINGTTNSTVDTIYNTSLDLSLAMPSTVGGIAVGTTAGYLYGKTFVQMFDDLLFPLVLPTYTIPSVSISSDVTGILEVGSSFTASLTLRGDENDADYFSKLEILKSINGSASSTLLTISSTSSMTITTGSPIPNQFGYTDPNNPNYSYSITYSDSSITVPSPVSGGSSTLVYSGISDYSGGLPKNDNKGNLDLRTSLVRSVNAPQSSDTGFGSNLSTITGYYPYFYGKESTQQTDSDIVNIIESGSGFTKVVNNGSGSLSMSFNAVGEWPWFAIYDVYPTKSTWYQSPLNNGDIGLVPTDLFGSPSTLSVTSIDGYWTVNFKIYPSNKVTTLGTCTIS